MPMGEIVLHSGHEYHTAPHTEGVALLLTIEAQKVLIGWDITVSFRTERKNIRMNAVQCYVSTRVSVEAKNEFYNQLQGNLSKLNILMGDFNAKIGLDNTGYDEVMRGHGLGEMKVNG